MKFEWYSKNDGWVTFVTVIFAFLMGMAVMAGIDTPKLTHQDCTRCQP